MPYRVEPDDEVVRYEPRYLGPAPKTFFFHARYSAYALFAVIFGLMLLVEWITPMTVHFPPWKEAGFATLITSFVMLGVDHDKPITAAIKNVYNVARAPRTPSTTTIHRRPVLRRNIKITRKPL